MRATSEIGLFVALLISSGCSRESRLPLHEVRGTVTFQKKPAAKAIVVLRPISSEALGKLLPHGVVDADGAFRIGTYEDGDGAPAGDYRVTITWSETKADPAGGEIIGRDRLNGRFNDPGKSKWTVQVHEGSNVLDPFILD